MTMAGSVASPTAPSRCFSRSGPTGNNGSSNSSTPAAAGQIFDEHIRLACGERGARTDIGDDGAIGWDGTFLRHHDAAHLVADFGERKLQPVELFRRGDQHIAGAWRLMALQGLDVAIMKVRLRRTEGLAVAGDEADGLDPAP